MFKLGACVTTPGANAAIRQAGDDPGSFLKRHQSGDWGDCSEFDKQENQDALTKGGRIFSVYHTKKGEKIWVITEADRSSTCILSPDEY